MRLTFLRKRPDGLQASELAFEPRDSRDSEFARYVHPRMHSLTCREVLLTAHVSDKASRILNHTNVLQDEQKRGTEPRVARKKLSPFRFARISRLRTAPQASKSRVWRNQKTSWRRSRRVFKWLVASSTIAICSSKTAQVEFTLHSGALTTG